MPSGSHGGSSGSHSSGGSSFGGGGSSWGSSSSSSRSSRPMRIRWHGRVYVVSNGINGFFVCALILLIFALIPLIVGVVGQNKYIDKIEADYAYYQNMIKIAEKDPSNLIVDGTVTDCFRNEEANKWYITYEIRKDGVVLEGYSYSIYSMIEAQDLLGDTIQIAVNHKTVTLKTDSIPMDYKDTTLTDDGEYVNEKEHLKDFVIMLVILSVIEITVIVFGIRSFKKHMKLEAETSTKTKNTPLPTKETSIFTEKTWTCEYCGNKNDITNNKCSNCGAKRK